MGKLDFEDVNYWQCAKEGNGLVTATCHIGHVFCWAAHAALFHFYGVKRKILDKKRFGVFKHHTLIEHEPLLRGFDDEFMVPHSRYAEIEVNNLKYHHELAVLASSKQAGAYLISDKKNKNIFVLGHPEYQKLTLQQEYFRDISAGIKSEVPENYFPNNDPDQNPKATWYSHGNLLISNWLNYYVYQTTPYKL